jgi:hypothetical protein
MYTCKYIHFICIYTYKIRYFYTCSYIYKIICTSIWICVLIYLCVNKGMTIANALRTNQTLQCMHANNCGFNLKVLIALATTLRQNTTLELLVNIYIYIYIYIYMYAYISRYRLTFMRFKCIFIYANWTAHVFLSKCTFYVYFRLNIDKYIHKFIFLYVYIYICMHIYICIYIYMYIYKYLFIQSIDRPLVDTITRQEDGIDHIRCVYLYIYEYVSV